MDGISFELRNIPLAFTLAQIDNAVSDFLGLENGAKVSKALAAVINPDNWPDLIPSAISATQELIDYVRRDLSRAEFSGASDLVDRSRVLRDRASDDGALYVVRGNNYQHANFYGLGLTLGEEFTRSRAPSPHSIQWLQ